MTTYRLRLKSDYKYKYTCKYPDKAIYVDIHNISDNMNISANQNYWSLYYHQRTFYTYCYFSLNEQ